MSLECNSLLCLVCGDISSFLFSSIWVFHLVSSISEICAYCTGEASTTFLSLWVECCLGLGLSVWLDFNNCVQGIRQADVPIPKPGLQSGGPLWYCVCTINSYSTLLN